MPKHQTSNTRQKSFVMREIRTIIMSISVLVIGGGGAAFNHYNQANDTEWIGQHLHQKASVDDVEYLQSEIDDLKKELRRKDDTVGFVPRGGAVVALELHTLPVVGSIPTPATNFCESREVWQPATPGTLRSQVQILPLAPM